MASAEFRYVTTNLLQAGSTANPIIAELPFTDVNFTSQLNSNGTFQGHILLSGLSSNQVNAYQGTIPGKTILWVLYTNPYTATSTPVWSGVIWAREYDSASQTLSISAQEMMSLYGRRRISTTKDYSNTFYDPATIAYELMQYAEALPNGKTGLTYNSLTTAYATKKIYEGYELKSVYQAVKDLAANFFDFTIRPYLSGNDLKNIFALGDPLGVTYSSSSPTATVLQFPGNLVEYRFPEDASGAANKLYGLGYGDNNTKILATATDPSKISTANIFQAVYEGGTTVEYYANNSFSVGQTVIVTGMVPTGYNGTFVIVSRTPTRFTVADTGHGVTTVGGIARSEWPLLEDTVNYIDIGDTQLLKDLTLGQLNAISYPPTTIEVVIPPYIDPIYPTYSIGDQVRLDIKDDYFPSGLFGEILRIVAISVNPGENGPSRVTLTLTRLLASGTVS